jgi:rsbT co-antagonist protein RsbR
MKLVDAVFPLPFYTINKNYKIQSYSKEAQMIFGEKDNLLDVLDEASVRKVKNWVSPEHPKSHIEVHVKAERADADVLTADLVVKWENDLHAEVMLIVKDERLKKVTHTMNQLRSRLHDTNFELLEEKEKLELAMEQNNKLSAPFIELDQETALIPIFGHLTVEKIYTIEHHLLHVSQQAETDRLLFDFTAVGEFDDEGVKSFLGLMDAISLMGMGIIFIGVRPNQAQQLKKFPISKNIRFLHSLQMAISKYCTGSRS